MANNKYDLVETHIDYLRRLLKETSDDTYYQDEEIYKALIDARAMIVERHLKKGKGYPDSLYQTICIMLCEDDYNDCDCVPAGYDCRVLKTIKEIPTVFFNGYTDTLRISTLSGEEIEPSTDALARLRKYRKTRKKSLYYIMNNKKLSIFNSPFNRLKVIKVRAIFEDPVGAAEIGSCSNNSDPSIPCVDVQGTGFGVKMSDNIDLYEIALKSLLIMKQIAEDRSNNSDSTIPTQSY